MSLSSPVARRYAIWRRAVLWVAVVPTGFAALFGLIGAIATETAGLSGLGVLVVYLQALALAAIPVTAILAANAYDKPSASAKWLFIGQMAASLGFLVWNWAPARIFLGDVGSVPLGYLLGCLLLGATADGGWKIAVILPLYFLADSTITLLRPV